MNTLFQVWPDEAETYNTTVKQKISQGKLNYFKAWINN